MSMINIIMITEDCYLVIRKPQVTFREEFSTVILTRGRLLGVMAESVVKNMDIATVKQYSGNMIFKRNI